MKTTKITIDKKDKILGNPDRCKRWLVWFRYNINGHLDECCGSNAWYPVDGRISLATIDANILQSNAYRYKPKDAVGYRIWKGSINDGNFITEIKTIK